MNVKKVLYSVFSSDFLFVDLPSRVVLEGLSVVKNNLLWLEFRLCFAFGSSSSNENGFAWF